VNTLFARSRLLHTMLRVGDLERSLEFYISALGMKLLRRKDYSEGRFTLAFIGYSQESEAAVIELTHNWDSNFYDKGTAFGHIAVSVKNIEAACTALRAAGVSIVREPGPMKHDTTERIAFIEDPDGYRVELIQSRHVDN
jgi:lactoylglutathione lyase